MIFFYKINKNSCTWARLRKGLIQTVLSFFPISQEIHSLIYVAVWVSYKSNIFLHLISQNQVSCIEDSMLHSFLMSRCKHHHIPIRRFASIWLWSPAIHSHGHSDFHRFALLQGIQLAIWKVAMESLETLRICLVRFIFDFTHRSTHATRVPSLLNAPIFVLIFTACSNNCTGLNARPGHTENAFSTATLFNGLSSMPSGGLKIPQFYPFQAQAREFTIVLLTECQISVLFHASNDKIGMVAPQSVPYFFVLILLWVRKHALHWLHRKNILENDRLKAAIEADYQCCRRVYRHTLCVCNHPKDDVK